MLALPRCLRSLFCAHKWKLAEGRLDAFTVSLLSYNGSLYLSTANQRQPDGSYRIWAWECKKCGKGKMASNDEVARVF